MSTHHDQFRRDHMVLGQISESRQVRVMKLLAEVEAWLGRELHTIEPEELVRWMTERIAAKSDPNTVRFWLNMLRPYLHWAWKNGRLIEAEQWLLLSEVKPPRGATGRTTPRPYKRPEIKRFWIDLDETFKPLENPERFLRRFERGTSPYRSLRQHLRNRQTRAIVSLALFEGLRRDEIYGASIPELHPENAYIPVSGKRVDHREKLREVPYMDPAREAVREWLRLRKALKPRHKQPWLALISPKPERAMSHAAFAELLAKVGDGYELHRFRHTFATERLRAGVELERLQRILGHSNVDQTLAYAQLLREDLQGAMERSDAGFMDVVGG